jgi:hypothetical protein
MLLKQKEIQAQCNGKNTWDAGKVNQYTVQIFPGRQVPFPSSKHQGKQSGQRQSQRIENQYSRILGTYVEEITQCHQPMN